MDAYIEEGMGGMTSLFLHEPITGENCLDMYQRNPDVDSVVRDEIMQTNLMNKRRVVTE